MSGPLDFLPLWTLFGLTVALVIGSIEAGFWLGTRRSRSRESENQSSVANMAAASLGLLAFLLGFTFSFAASRLETRRSVLLQEVNAIGTTWLRAATLPEPERAQARELLREYVDTRLEAVRAGKLDAAVQHSAVLQTRLWDSAAALATRTPNSIVVGLYLQTLNEMIDLHTTRLNEALRVRIPIVIWAVLFALTAIAMAQIGYQIGLSGSRRPLAVPALALAFSVVMLLIADLDRPHAGWVRVSQIPMQELRDSMVEPSSAPR